VDRYFLDSSALFKRYLDELGTSRVIELTLRPEAVIVSRLAMVEIGSAATRLAHARGISDDLLRHLLTVLAADFHERFDVIELRPEGYASRADPGAIPRIARLRRHSTRVCIGGFE